MGLRIILPYLLICYFFFYYNGVQGYGKLSKKEDLELEEQLKHMNKPSVKTIKTKYGDIYDCVDFHKQPAFDHPLLKNHNFHPEMRPTSIPKRLNPEKDLPTPNYKQVKMGLEGGGCPIGTVPIRRTTKDDLVRAKLHSEMYASKINPSTADQPGTHYAMARTIEETDYDGVGGMLSVYNLPTKAPQYTSGLMKIKNGDESLQTGWTVNPSLYGDNRTRMFIYTNAGQSHCFNAQCGYVQVKADLPVDMVLEPVSIYGVEQYATTFSIHQDVSTGNWWLKHDENGNLTDIGFWPKQLFTYLGNRATGAEWGGEVFSPPDVPSPGMGSGHLLRHDTLFDAFFAHANIVVNNTIMNPPETLYRNYDDRYDFKIANEGDVGGDIRYLILFGGEGGAKGN